MSAHLNPVASKATISLFGDVFASDFPDWILRHAQKLGVRGAVERFDDRLKVTASGHNVMLEALALGCSLGPASVMVERIEFEPSDDA